MSKKVFTRNYTDSKIALPAFFLQKNEKNIGFVLAPVLAVAGEALKITLRRDVGQSRHGAPGLQEFMVAGFDADPVLHVPLFGETQVYSIP